MVEITDREEEWLVKGMLKSEVPHEEFIANVTLIEKEKQIVVTCFVDQIIHKASSL